MDRVSIIFRNKFQLNISFNTYELKLKYHMN